MSKLPYPFQEAAIQVGLDRNLFLNDECGCGKKITMLEIARRLREVYKLPTLVVTVKRDTLQWKREILGQDPTIPVVIGTSDVLWVPEVDDWWLVLHYEALVRHIKGLSRVKFGTVILDEGHYIKSWQAQRTKAAKRLQASVRSSAPERRWIAPQVISGVSSSFSTVKRTEARVERSAISMSDGSLMEPDIVVHCLE